MGTNDTSDASRHTGEPSDIGDHGGTGDSEPDTRPISVVSPRAVSRHRPAPGRWTPSARGGYASHARTEPIPPVSQLSGSIEVEFTASQGVLSVPDDEAEEVTREPVVRRTKVVLTAPSDKPRTPRDEDTRVYAAPPGGLGKFDLGSVPASVTPPRTWRRAAWFSGAASGAAVVAMLLAGTALVSDPAEDAQALDRWPDHHSAPPSAIPDHGGNGATRTDENDDRSVGRGENGERGAESTGPTITSSSSGTTSVSAAGRTVDTGPGTTDNGIAASSTRPQKPPITPATTDAARVALWAPHDTDTLAQRSQDYFNTVTEDPEAAHAMTTGELAAAGPEGLADKYADVAYFEVREVYVDASEGYTLNTVDVTYVDGSREQQTRKLVFGTDDRIEADVV
ncbi:hypothetical protein SAMN02982918_1251 [Saccharomonospora viridis]|jgi:hypothetical protein|uniref:Uncharacterized protein n=1 Tax=Saccharomonospora viridis TaxID=1852 RepID=A0A837DC71_9PSEU|nr:hypothetical protein MINT15_20790 [Saccharomonospora viridis]SFP10641.1 hypothetical protein SAMN02982918_1251 [Saccharomonospora viridis]